MTRATRKIILAAAQLAAREGRHDDARRLFASCGISYTYTPARSN